MKKQMEKDAVFLLGLAALVLRRQLYLTAVDVKGLLLRWHPLETALTALTFGAMLLIVLAVRKKELQVIVFKDASRLGRNLKESLHFPAVLQEI